MRESKTFNIRDPDATSPTDVLVVDAWGSVIIQPDQESWLTNPSSKLPLHAICGKSSPGNLWWRV